MKRVLLFIALTCLCALSAVGQVTGTSNGAGILVNGQPVMSRGFVLQGTWNGTPASGTVLNRFIVPTFPTTALSITLPANCANATAYVGTAATGSTAFTVSKNGTTICTLTIASGCTGTSCLSVGTGGTATTVTTGDYLTLSGGGDQSLANISISVPGTATGGVY